MALILCTSCNAKISKNAKACPNCGEPQRKRTSLITWLVLSLIVLIVFLSGKIDSHKPAHQATDKNLIDIEKEAKERASLSYNRDMTVNVQKTVAGMMKDPESVKFRHVFVNTSEKGGTVVCGQYDSKNSFGAYTGFKRFVSNGKTTFIEEIDSNIGTVWADVCTTQSK